MSTRSRQSKKTTIYDIAELAGTSASAVSAVLNGTWKKRRISASLAEKVTRIAEEQGYAVNMQASLLRREKSRIVGMIVPKYDNRYFGSIVETFEAMARERGLFPVITCTRRDPELEVEAARELLSYQVEWLVSTGATDPDRITGLCSAAGVKSLNLDLPGSRAPSVISDNFGGALRLTRRIIANARSRHGLSAPLLFIGGRGSDHNTRERVRGFRAAMAEEGLETDDRLVLTCGYAAEKSETALQGLTESGFIAPSGLFVNSTISLEGVMRWLKRSGLMGPQAPAMGCFDWDPFVSLLGDGIEMVRQDVPAMLDAVFAIIDRGEATQPLIQIPPLYTDAQN